ncbi:hypothetical protein GCM10027448_36260 [Nocardioides dilutus]
MPACLLSLVSFAAGLGLALPRLSKDDGGVVAWLGLLALAGGGSATIWCCWRLLRAVRRRWWLLVLPALLVAAYLVLWTVTQGVMAGLPAHPALGSRTPADVGLGYESVAVRTDDGVELAAWWVPGENGAAIVLLHGAGSTRTAVLAHADVLATHGYGVLLLDARGHGGSEGRGMDFGWYGELDVAAALDFLGDQPEVAPDGLGVVGLSMGGEEAIGAAGADPRVRVVVAEGATHRVAADKAYLSEYGVRGDIQRAIDRGTYGVAALLSPAPEPPPLRESVADAQADGSATPILLVVAGEVETEGLAARLLDRAAPEAVQIWTVPGAGHTAGLRTEPEEWQRRVLEFLDAALVRTGEGRLRLGDASDLRKLCRADRI